MKALTIWQPWASAIMTGAKRVENRTWSTSYRGLLAIHAGQRYDPDGEVILAEAGVILPQAPQDLPRGVLLGVVDLIDVVRKPPPRQQTLGGDFGPPDPYDLTRDPLACGPFCWILRNCRSLPSPIPYAGKQGLWNLSPLVIPGVAGGGQDRGG